MCVFNPSRAQIPTSEAASGNAASLRLHNLLPFADRLKIIRCLIDVTGADVMPDCGDTVIPRYSEESGLKRKGQLVCEKASLFPGGPVVKEGQIHRVVTAPLWMTTFLRSTGDCEFIFL